MATKVIATVTGLLLTLTFAFPRAARAQSSDEAPPLPGDTVAIMAVLTDADTRAVLPEAVIQLSGYPSRYVTDLQGRASFKAAVGHYTLTIRKGGYQTLTGDFAVHRAGGFALALRKREMSDPSAPARLVVEVFDADNGRPIDGAAVALAGVGTAPTDSRGFANFSDLKSRLALVTVSMIGYATRAEPVALHPGFTTALEVAMTVQAVPLEQLVVTVRSRFLEANGVYDRIDAGLPKGLLTRSMIERRGSPRLADALAQIPGLQIRRSTPSGTGGQPSRSVVYARGCELSVFVDGVPWKPDVEGTVDIDRIPPDWLELAEFYWGAAIPVQFDRNDNNCGAMVIWTKRGAGS